MLASNLWLHNGHPLVSNEKINSFNHYWWPQPYVCTFSSTIRLKLLKLTHLVEELWNGEVPFQVWGCLLRTKKNEVAPKRNILLILWTGVLRKFYQTRWIPSVTRPMLPHRSARPHHLCSFPHGSTLPPPVPSTQLGPPRPTMTTPPPPPHTSAMHAHQWQFLSFPVPKNPQILLHKLCN
jgi:hypothetical protein